jgi:hypothetical protein
MYRTATKPLLTVILASLTVFLAWVWVDGGIVDVGVGED